MIKVRSSRRAAGLQPSDYDHEITLIDGEDAQSPALSSSGGGGGGGGAVSADTSTRLLSDHDEEEEEQRVAGEDQGEETRSSRGSRSDGDGGGDNDEHRGHQPQIAEPKPEPELEPEPEHQLSPPESRTSPSIEIQAPTPSPLPQPRVVPKRQKEKRETVIDILYENERGGFLCGTALFSGAALGCLDPTAWTNAYHRSSPTNINTAQVPDPSWEWVWPEWRINHQEGMDEGGWEYSFAFSKTFSWHDPKWWNSFVRRRAWIRRRAKKRPEDVSTDPHMLSTADYFSVCAASDRGRRSPGSLTSSRAPSKSPSKSPSRTSVVEDEKPVIEDMDVLLQVLRAARIDREKREAVENYLENAIDLTELRREMHEIMSLFVFQASRRQLLSYLMQKHEEATLALDKDKTLQLKLRKEALDAATKHAEEEVYRLAYWSDVKQMAESGELRDVLDAEEHCDAWTGLDKSAPAPPGNGSSLLG